MLVMLDGMQGVTVCNFGMVRSLFVIATFGMFGSFAMMFGRVFVMFRRLLVVFIYLVTAHWLLLSKLI